MPWSWVRVPTGTSPALSTCVASKGPPTRQAYADCIIEIINARRGEDLRRSPIEVKFEANGRRARALFEWADHTEKHWIMFALHASDAIDLLTLEEADLLEEREKRFLEQQEPESTS